ncbi:MAG TPA: hypothetical protein VKV40_03175 [Ktedonobacteraceae bacterium]|nr:hypothetical protein [Ktedonobacteraceae bacterium]
MHQLFNEAMARQHREQLQREALAARERNATRVQVQGRRTEDPESVGVQWHSLGLLHLYWVRVVGLFGRTLIIHRLKSPVQNADELRQELHPALTSMREVSPEFDDEFVEHIVRSLEEQFREKLHSK